LESRRFGERLRAPEILIYGTDEEIVAGDRDAYSKKFGEWRDFFDRTVMLSHILFDWLRFFYVVVGLFFGSDTVMVRIAK
jgi:hypothetical protein